MFGPNSEITQVKSDGGGQGIQDVIENANSRDTIVLQPGSYTGGCPINPSSWPNQLTITGDGYGAILEQDSNEDIFQVSVDVYNLTIEYMLIKGDNGTLGGSAIDTSYSGTRFPAQALFNNLTVTGRFDYAINLSSYSDSEIYNLVADEFENDGNAPNNGVRVQDATVVTVTGGRIRGVTNNGIHIDGTTAGDGFEYIVDSVSFPRVGNREVYVEGVPEAVLPFPTTTSRNKAGRQESL